MYFLLFALCPGRLSVMMSMWTFVSATVVLAGLVLLETKPRWNLVLRFPLRSIGQQAVSYPLTKQVFSVQAAEPSSLIHQGKHQVQSWLVKHFYFPLCYYYSA